MVDFVCRKKKKKKPQKKNSCNIYIIYIYSNIILFYIAMETAPRHPYFLVRGEILRPRKDELQRKHLSSMFSSNKNES